MTICDLQPRHLPEARQLAWEAARQARQAVPDLPPCSPEDLPDLTPMAENGLGAAALEEGSLVGFLAVRDPRPMAYGSTAAGVFSPIHAHGVLPGSGARLWQRLYQAAAEKWVAAGIGYHSIALYDSDRTAMETFWRCGFGQRCVDAVRLTDPRPMDVPRGLVCRELRREEIPLVRPLRRLLARHLTQSPCFMSDSPAQFDRWLVRAEARDTRLFGAFFDNRLAGFMEVGDEGENFLTLHPSMKNICGACFEPTWRHTGGAAALLEYMAGVLHSEGVARLGVDYESFNLAGDGFWRRHFTTYTCSLTRRIDEGAMTRAIW